MEKYLKISIVEEDNNLASFKYEQEGLTSIEIVGILEMVKADVANKFFSSEKPISTIEIQPEDFKICRIKLKLSMTDVQKITGVNKSTISRIEQGKDTSYSSVKKLKDFYGKSTNN